MNLSKAAFFTVAGTFAVTFISLVWTMCYCQIVGVTPDGAIKEITIGVGGYLVGLVTTFRDGGRTGDQSRV